MKEGSTATTVRRLGHGAQKQQQPRTAAGQMTACSGHAWLQPARMPTHTVPCTPTHPPRRPPRRPWARRLRSCAQPRTSAKWRSTGGASCTTGGCRCGAGAGRRAVRARGRSGSAARSRACSRLTARASYCLLLLCRPWLTQRALPGCSFERFYDAAARFWALVRAAWLQLHAIHGAVCVM